MSDSAQSLASNVNFSREQRVYDSHELIPTQWHGRDVAVSCRVCNPAVVRHEHSLLMAYRVDLCRGGTDRPARVACAICRLGPDWQVIPGSVQPLSDTIVDGGSNHYDPRFLVFRERLFIHYNNNWDTDPNRIYLVEVDSDTLEARSLARPVQLDGPRQAIEKNWMFFEHAGDLYAVYQIDPHQVLRVEPDTGGPILCRPAHAIEWDTSAYARHYGRPRGGAPPVCAGSVYLSVFHSRREPRPLPGASLAASAGALQQVGWWQRVRRRLRERLAPIRYYGGTYAFDAAPPFAPRCIHPQPVLRPETEARRRRPTAGHLSPRQVVYPGGLVRLDDGRWLVAYGVHDERCVVRSLQLPDGLERSIDAAREARA